MAGKQELGGGPRTVKVVCEVTAGIVPGYADGQYTRRYTVASDDWAAAQAKAEQDQGAAMGVLLSEANGRALGYAGLLMLQPEQVNWVRLDWLFV